MVVHAKRIWSGAAAALFGVLVLMGMAGQVAAAGVLPEARAALPEAVRAAGVLKVATSLQWPPFGYKTDAGEMEGIDIRLLNVLAEKLGLKLEMDDVKFPVIVPGVTNGRYNVGMNQIAITADRAKVVDFVPYLKSGFSLLVRRGSTDLDINNLCGHTLVLTQGSGQIPVAEKLSAACVAAGKKEITFQFYPNSADTYLALANGRGDGFIVGQASGVYIAKGNPRLAMTTSVLADSLSISGIVVAKGNVALQNALLMAMESAVADGSYMKIMTEFGVPDGALTAAEMRQNAKQ